MALLPTEFSQYSFTQKVLCSDNFLFSTQINFNNDCPSIVVIEPDYSNLQFVTSISLFILIWINFQAEKENISQNS